MKTPRPHFVRRNQSGFTLIEMIGVMAIMAIMATVFVPNVLRSIDRAAVVGEQQTMRDLGAQVKKYLHDFGTPPGAGTWVADIALYAEDGTSDIATNRRQMNRVYLLDPTVVPSGLRQRAIILSSMRQGMTLPTALNINTALRFDALWDSVDGTVPSAASWNGWTAAAADYLVIERINFRSEYRTVILQNVSNVAPAVAASAYYQVLSANGLAVAPANFYAIPNINPVTPGQTVTLTLVPNERLTLYNGPTVASGINYSYVVSTAGKKFDFNGANWIPQ